jgi:hypothetical protein
MNLHEDRPVGTASGLNTDRGTFFRALVAPALAAGLLLGSNAAQAVVSGEFVGAIPNPDPIDPPGGNADELVAVVVNDASPTGRRAIRVYLCDGDPTAQGDAEWFIGVITGDTFNLTSSDGDATTQGQLTETAATGTVSLPDGRTVSFRALPARAGGGFYDVFLLANGTLQGVSPSGNTFTARVVSERTVGAQLIQTAAVIIQTLEGQTIRYQATFIILGQTQEQASANIVVPTAKRATGRGNNIKSSSGSSGVTYRDINL